MLVPFFKAVAITVLTMLVGLGCDIALGEDIASDEALRAKVSPLIESACIHCHDSSTETSLDLTELEFAVDDPQRFEKWEQVYDRVNSGEMPPESEERPAPRELKSAMEALQTALHAESLRKQQLSGRVNARRLTKLELGYTLRDLLLIEEDVTSGVPEEAESGSFDTVGDSQRLSAVHMESYLDAADKALELAIRLGKSPTQTTKANYSWLKEWHDKELSLGGSITRELEDSDGIVLFRDIDYLTQFQFQSFNPYGGTKSSGIHRLTAVVSAYQSKKPLTAKIIIKDPSGAARLATAVDVLPGEPQTMVVETALKPGEVPYLTYVDVTSDGIFAAGGAQNYRGPGLAIYAQTVEGPLFESWPPPSTQKLLPGLKLGSKSMMLDAIRGVFGGGGGASFSVEPTQEHSAHVSEIVHAFAPHAFRRPVSDEELAPFIELAKSAIEQQRPILDVARIPLRSMLASPQFLMFDGRVGELDDYALASRLSYFLWKSMPDEELFQLAESGELSRRDKLAEQVERMLADQKSSRFVDDFLGQWLLLHKVNVTTPDDGLYPEFDELLSHSIPRETQLFFTELIRENLSVSNLIDSDFTMLNRRLAEHYGIDGIQGQEFRRVDLPPDSPRGGVLTHAAILKTTANGTNTSPVMRGNFVLTNFLGTPPSPPPPDVGSIEPDTRGQTTIREILAAHREIDSCNQCHREIDPPGFALESFDPVGGFRTHYRISGGEHSFGGFVTKLPPKQGLPVDSSGVTSDGSEFQSIVGFKAHLMSRRDQVARNLIENLVVYSTGAEIQFADREVIESILDQTRAQDFPVRVILHAVVQSRLFLHQ